MSSLNNFSIKKKRVASVQDGKVIIFDEHWITVNGEDNDGKGQHVLIKENGDIIAGLGGKFKNLRDLKNKSIDEEVKKELERAKNTTLHNFDKTREEAETYARNWAQLTEEEEKEYNETIKEIFNNSDYAMRVPECAVEDILNSEFRNQIDFFETEHREVTRGEPDPEWRKSQSETLFGHKGKDIDGKVLNGKDYEKYGYLAAKEGKDFIEGEKISSAASYGDVVIRFKKDRLEGRVTYTIGDSLGFGTGAGDAGNPSIAGIGSQNLREIVDRKQDIKSPYEFDPSYFKYIELQYHGRLTPKDIESITFTDPDYPPSPKLVKKIKDMGIKVDRYKDEKFTKL